MSQRTESFDVFGTLLTRCVLEPSDIFLLLGCRLQELGLVSSPEYFQQRRMAAENGARRQTPREDTTLEEIYSILTETLGWTSDYAKRAAQEELACERNALVPLAAVCKTLKEAYDSGARILCISDIYLPRDFVSEQLKLHLPIDDFGVYVSSEIGLTKHSGRLFAYISGKESLSYEQWRHRGDNLHSDVRVPRQLGIEAQQINLSSQTRYEKCVVQSSTDILARTLSGCMRATRLSRCYDSPHFQNLWELSSNVVAPVFLGFCYWLLCSARRDGIQRLYFVARDGQILLKIAKTIQEMVPAFSDIECRYLYGSRQAWHTPAISHVDSMVLDWIFDDTAFLSVKVILSRLCEGDYEIPPKVRDAICSCIPHHKWASNLPVSDRLRLRRLFEQNENIAEWILSLAKQSRDNTIAYFRQEGLLQETTWAMVDIGWRGRLQNSLSRILALSDRPPKHGVRGYYWGLRDKSPYCPNDQQLAFSEELPDKWRDILFYNASLYEIFASADHGSTIGYRQIAGKWEPVLRDVNPTELTSWGVQYLQEAAATFSRNFLQNWKGQIDLNQYMSLVLPMLREFFFHPTNQDVMCLEAKPLYECQTESIRLTLAPKELGWPLFASWVWGRRIANHGIWLHGIVSKQPLYLRVLLFCAFRWKRLISISRQAVKRLVKTRH